MHYHTALTTLLGDCPELGEEKFQEARKAHDLDMPELLHYSL